jgi:putative nucleotidyltransferase with HDIG domain
LRAEYGRIVQSGAVADDSAVQRALEALAQSVPRAQFGHFVLVVIDSAERRQVAKLADTTSPLASQLPELFDSASMRYPTTGTELAAALRVDGATLVPVATKITDEAGNTIAYLNGLFQLSSSALAALDRGIWITVLAAVAIVLLTTLVVYPIIRGLLRRLGELSIQLLDANIEILQVLGSAIAKRDSDTDVHNYRVTVYAVRLAEALGVDRAAIRGLIKGAFLHDVGKIGIRDHILLKPGRLNQDEFEEMKKHVPHGIEIVRRSRWLNNATDVVAHHHEKYDGTGYYGGLAGKDIPLAARIFAIVDVFDALSSERPYKRPIDLEQSLQILREGAGAHFDPDLLQVFEGIAPKLHAAFGNRDQEARQQLALIVDRYFRDDLSGMMQEATG